MNYELLILIGLLILGLIIIGAIFLFKKREERRIKKIIG